MQSRRRIKSGLLSCLTTIRTVYIVQACSSRFSSMLSNIFPVMVSLFCSRCRQVAKRGGCHRGLQHGRSSNPLGLVPEHLWRRRYCYRAALVTAWFTKQHRVPPHESEHLRGKTSATVYGWLILAVFGSYNYLFHFFLLCNSNFHPKNTFFCSCPNPSGAAWQVPLPRLIEGRPFVSLNMRTPSSVGSNGAYYDWVGIEFQALQKQNLYFDEKK